jgi:demethylmenaquinone methyltransferase/2-methoxy-6-polyprenyl-1,4-benzoquinol methylase
VPAEAKSDPWSRLAGLYDLQLPLERPAVKALIELLEVSEQDSLLDLATGTAAVLRELARSAKPPRSVTGVDRAPAMLAQAPELPAGWTLLEADARALPFADESFDVVTASYLLHLIDRDDRARVIREARRVLRPGGRLGVVTVAPPVGPLSSLASRPIRALAARSSGVLAGLRPLDPREELQAAGLRPLRARRARAVPPALCVVAERVD